VPWIISAGIVRVGYLDQRFHHSSISLRPGRKPLHLQ
jgi:hypothetical protein